MNRQFFPPFGGFGPVFPQPFFHPPFFFPQRRLFPFFLFSPFVFPFFRGEEDRDGAYVIHHQCAEGDTMEKLAERYNVPVPVLEVINPHIGNVNVFTAGTTVYIPRMDKMHCHKMYMEHEGEGTMPVPTPYSMQSMSASPAYSSAQTYSAYPGL